MATKAEAKSAFDGVVGKIYDAVKDLATLDVTTLSADINLNFFTEGDDGSKTISNPTKIFESLQSEIAEGSTGKLVGHTHIEVDFDSVTIVGNGATEEQSAAHAQAVKAAQDARLGVFRLVQELL